ncbi:Afadin and alpha-actinin-binding-domain-containing protein [Xylariaceae sp. FL0662B]|nr:Afadin and alpha-actinin-binding-domain-containing protein [Xylariaceae sp. FL0662B]
MIDHDNLRTASLYINNQLLSRGLLRDGQEIDFADPDAGDGGLEGTMSRVMSVVNDLILRRDRDAEHRESMSTTLRTLRADSQRQTTEFARQTEKLCDTQRKLDSADATERALRAQLKAADQNVHRLKDEVAKMKATVVQSRAACATEVRKRDRQIDGLKKAVTDAARVRGGSRSRDVLSITVTGDVGGDEPNGGLPPGATEAEGYSLRLETNEFLTELARGLSEENEGLLGLVRSTVERLREMSGLERDADSVHGSGNNINNNMNGNNADGGGDVVVSPQKGAEELAAELEAIMEHLRTILTNPSFVPIEEVEVREEVINRLRVGLETMEARWNDAVHMIDGWRNRMVSSGRSVDMDDLRMGLRLSPVRVRDVKETSGAAPMRLSCVREEAEEEEEEEEEAENDGDDDARQEAYEQAPEPERLRSPSPVESLHLVPAPGYEIEENEAGSDSDSSIFQDEIDMDELDAEEPNVQVLQESTATSMDSPPLPEPPRISPLKDSYSSGNRGYPSHPSYRKRPGDFTTIVEENTWDLVAEEAEEEEQAPVPPPHIIKPQSSPGQQKVAKPSPQRQREQSPSSSAVSYESPLFGKSGERPSQSHPSRKLFSKPSGSSPKTRHTTSSHPPQPELENPSPSKSTKRPSSSRKASPEPPTAAVAALSTLTKSAKRTASDPNPNPNPNMSPNPKPAAREQPPAQGSPSKSSSNTSGGSGSSSGNSTTAGEQRTSRNNNSTNNNNRSPVRNLQGSSRLPRPNNPPPQQNQSPLTMATIAAKLAASEREADAARVRAKLRAMRKGRRPNAVAPETATTATETTAATAPPPPAAPAPIPEEEEAAAAAVATEAAQLDKNSVDPVKRDPPRSLRERDAEADELAASMGSHRSITTDGQQQQPQQQSEIKVAKQRRRGRDAPPGRRTSSRVASRRRSTLSPWELESLIHGVESPAR